MNSEMFLKEKGKFIVTVDDINQKLTYLKADVAALLNFEFRVNQGEVNGNPNDIKHLHHLCDDYRSLMNLNPVPTDFNENERPYLYLELIAMDNMLRDDMETIGLHVEVRKITENNKTDKE